MGEKIQKERKIKAELKKGIKTETREVEDVQ